MRKFFLWIKRDKAGRDRIEQAKAERDSILGRMEEQANEAKNSADNLRRIRRSNHLAQLFDEEFGRGRG